MNKFDALSYVWSNDFVQQVNSLNENILNESIDSKYENIKLAFLRQMVCSKNALTGEGVGLNVDLADDFKDEFHLPYEYHLLKWVSYINFVDELTQCPEVDYANFTITFNSTKFYNFLQQLSLDEVVGKFVFNSAFFTELVYLQQFFGCSCKKTSFLISLLFKKLCVFGLVWMDKATALCNSPMTKKLTEVAICVKMYSIILSLPITTSRKMFAYFQLLNNNRIETRYEKLVVLNPYYIALHDFFYKNAIVNMYDYQNGASQNMHLKDVTCNFTLREVNDFMFDEGASVFKDTTIYERLANKSVKLINEEELHCNASKWFTDLTKQQKHDLLPFITLNKGGRDVIVTLRRENTWFVNGGEQNDREDEWAIWRRYVTCLTVECLEGLEQNDVQVQVINKLFFIL